MDTNSGRIFKDQIETCLRERGYRFLIGMKCQTWDGFCMDLFDDCRNEFEPVTFVYDLKEDIVMKFYSMDEKSLTSAYFGRPLEYTYYHLKKMTSHSVGESIDRIESVLSDLCDAEKCILSRPKLVLNRVKIKDDIVKLEFLMLWQSSQKDTSSKV